MAQGDEGLLMAPEANFGQELARMNLGRTRIKAAPLGVGSSAGAYALQSQAAETGDLREALTRASLDRGRIDQICLAHQAERQKLSDFQQAIELWKSESRFWSDESPEAKEFRRKKPAFPKLKAVQGLPAEFAHYFEGLKHWHNPQVQDKSAARHLWEKILALPPDQRRFKSTWAAFMLGKSLERSEPNAASNYFKQVRELARSGFKDSIGLAAASLGLEARVEFRENNYAQAIDLYLEQLAAGDPSAENSLLMVAGEASSAEEAQLAELARHPRAQRVVTAYLISRCPTHYWLEFEMQEDPGQSDEGNEPKSLPEKWLAAVEAAGVRDVASAEALALAAYQAGNMELAQRWIARAPASPLSQWLQAKLLLRAGKVNEAGALLAKLVPCFPLASLERESKPAQLKDALSVGIEFSYDRVPANRLLHAELGVLHLCRGEYLQALDALLNAGFWLDAAYVAERVLTLGELKSYVDRFWPATQVRAANRDQTESHAGQSSPEWISRQIRYLLARRLTRDLQGDVAREYYPAEWHGQFDALAAALRTGWDEAVPPGERAQALFAAAIITRTNGLELIGTEVEPDWQMHGGNFDYGVSLELRRGQRTTESVHATEDEIRRATLHQADPELRFHYRYHAAALAWEAAQLLPDNSDDTAYVLWRGGSFLKNRDPETADIFYKALVLRNRKTELGMEADRRRWFPPMDDNWLPIYRPQTENESQHVPEEVIDDNIGEIPFE